MAAPDAKTSPSSSKEVQQQSLTEMPLKTNDNAVVVAPKVASLKPPPPAAAAAAASYEAAALPKTVSTDVETTEESTITPSTIASAEPSYEETEDLEYFKLAKQLLAVGDFEQALETIEEGIHAVQATLATFHAWCPGKKEESDLHPSMAPLHYLYGTTLLFSIEESNDTQLTVAAGSNPEGSTEVGDAASAVASAVASVPPVNPEEHIEDMEIAWENLDTARNIVQIMLSTTYNDDTADDAQKKQKKTKLQLDLAQILLREGDLQRMNGRYEEAIDDYAACLAFRSEHMETYHRKVADAQYNLGLSHLSHATELLKEDEHTKVDAAKQKLSQEHCEKGVDLYVACAKTLCGQLAQLCGVTPESIVGERKSNDDDTPVPEVPKKAGLKTTGLDDEGDDDKASSTTSEASQLLQLWRNRASVLPTLAAGDSTVEDLRQLLEEIHETVNEAEKSQDAIRQACQIKIQAQKAVSAVAAEESGGATTIGFDAPTMDPSQVADVSKKSSSEAAAAQPMMVVKKKKKRDAPPAEDDSKPSSDKRPKTE